MKIVFTGGGTGGHFYPIIAVVQELQKIIREKKVLEPELYFFGPSPYDERLLFEHNLTFVKTPAGKMHRFFTLKNIPNSLQTGFGIIGTILNLYRVYPDVVFSKGGYGSVPTVVAARFLKIPVIVHDSDAIPGRATLLAAPYARKIAVSYNDAVTYFPEQLRERIAVVGNPVRQEIRTPARDGAHQFLDLNPAVPTILLLGGSSGAEVLNDVLLSALPELVTRYQVIHQTGTALHKEIEETARVVLEKSEFRYRYKSYPYLSGLALKMASGAADLVISRAGSGSIFEIASWAKPSIIIPIPENVSRDQRLNAFAYAHSGAAVVIEQNNLTPHLLISEVDRIFTNQTLRTTMGESAKKFARPEAAEVLAKAILETALEHET